MPRQEESTVTPGHGASFIDGAENGLNSTVTKKAKRSTTTETHNIGLLKANRASLVVKKPPAKAAASTPSAVAATNGSADTKASVPAVAPSLAGLGGYGSSDED